MGSFKQFLISVFLTLAIVMLGTIGYMLIEGWAFLDAVYMTIITLTTVGYGEVHEVSTTGKLFTILLICLGAGFFIYVAGALVQFMVEGRIRIILGRRRLNKKIGRLKNHYIICGYGRIGRVLCQKLKEKPLDLIVVEKNPDLIPVMDGDGVYYVAGEATDEENLIKAEIKSARGLVAVLASDAENVFLVLTARQLNPDLFIMARASEEASKTKLRLAGANKVESPYDMGATSMAQRILRPTVTNFLDFAVGDSRTDIQMEEIPISPSSHLANIMLKDSGIRQQFELIIIAIKKPDDSMIFNPSFETVLNSGDTVIAVGEVENLRKLEKVFNS
ncbi:potassium channel family protein [Thermodesulfobacteriota bacterium]